MVETIVDEKNPTALMAALASMAFSPNLPPLAQRVPPEKRAALADAVEQERHPAQRVRPDGDLGGGVHAARQPVQGRSASRAAKASKRCSAAPSPRQGKPIGELETNAQQLGFFDALPEHAQRQLLEGAIETPEDTGKDFRNMLNSWVKGDVAAIARSFNHDLAASPELKAALIERRNANWSRWIEQRMARPGSVLIAVGAGHLAGSGSVVDMLKRGGYKVQRVQ